MNKVKGPGEDEHDIVLYMRDDQDQTAEYALVSLILMKREDHIYLYSEKAFVHQGSLLNSEDHYEEITDQLSYFSIDDLEKWIAQNYDVHFDYPLIYHQHLVYFMIINSGDEALQADLDIFDRYLQEEDLNAFTISVDDYKRCLAFLHAQAMICMRLDHDHERLSEIVRQMLEYAEKIPHEQVDTMVSDAYEIAGDYYSDKDPEMALYYYVQVLSLIVNQEDDLFLAIIHEKSGDLERQLQRYDQAIASYLQAEKHFQKSNDQDEALMIQMAALYQDLSRCYEQKNDRQAMEKCLQNEESLLKQVVTNDPKQDNEHNYIIALRNIALFYSHGQSRQDLEKAITYYHLELNYSYQYEKRYAHVETSLSLAHAYHALGEMYLRYDGEEELREGIAYLEKDAEILKNRYQMSHLEKQGLEMAVAYHEISKAYALMSDQEAITALEKAMQLFKAFFEDYPKVSHFKNYLIVSSQLGERYVDSGDRDLYEKAHAIYSENVLWAHDLAIKQPAFIEEYARSLFLLGGFYALMDGEFYQRSAIDAYNKSIRYARRVQATDIEMNAKEGLGLQYMKQEDTSEAGALFREVLDYRQGTTTYELGRAYENLGRLYKSLGEEEDLRQAYAYHKQEAEVFAKVYEQSHSDHDYYNLLVAKRQIAELDMLENSQTSLHEAISLFQEIHQAPIALSDDLRGLILDRLGDAYRKLDGKEHLLQALHCYQEAGHYKIEGHPLDFSRIEKKCGYIHEKLKDLESAKDCYQEHLKIVTDLYEEHPDVQYYQEMAVGEHNMGMIERRLKNIEESNAHLNAEKKIRMALFHEDDCDAHRYALGIVHRHLGENYESLKQYLAALREYRVFYYHMTVLSEQPRYRQAYYVALEKLGNVHKHFNDPHHLIQAIDCYEKVYHFVEKMHNDRSLVTILQKLAFTYLKAGHLEEAMQLYEKQEKLLEGLITSDESYLEDYASCLNYKGMILKKNDPEKARELFEKVIALRQDEASTPYHFFRLGNTYRLLGEVTQNKDYYLAAIHCFENSQLKSSEPYRKACLEALKGLE